MPGPGGGAGGGGGGRGFGFGGGGGGFGGGGGYYRRPGFFFGFPFFFGGGLFSFLFMPLLVILLAGVLLFNSITMAFSDVLSGGRILYGESAAQEYADQQYRQEFGSLYGTPAYEDCLMLVVFVEDTKYQEYAYLAWVGDYIPRQAHDMLGGNSTVLGSAMEQYINKSSYQYSLDTNLAFVVDYMSEAIRRQNVDFSKLQERDHSGVRSYLKNETGIEMNADVVNAELEEFTEATGVPVVIVVEEAEDAFGRTIRKTSIITVCFSLILMGVAVFFIVKRVKQRRRTKQDNEGRDGYDPYGGFR